LLCKRKEILVAKSKEVKTERNLAKYSNEDYGSKRAVLPMMMMMMMMNSPTDCQEIPCPLWKIRVHYLVRRARHCTLS
jgi:hypothetical protein